MALTTELLMGADRVQDRVARYLCAPHDPNGVTLPWPLFWCAVVLLFAMVHCPREQVEAIAHALVTWLPALTSSQLFTGLVSLKTILFYGGMLMLAIPLVVSVTRWGRGWTTQQLRGRLLVTLLLFAALCLLQAPFQPPTGLTSMGDDYALMSQQPFTEPANLFNRRLLMPALAHMLFLRGLTPFYLFSLFITLIFLFLVVSYLDAKIGIFTSSPETARPHIRTWGWMLSLFTSSFIFYNFYYPGFPDPLLMLLLLLTMLVPMSAQGRLCAFALALATHEASLFCFAPLFLLAYPRHEWRMALGLPLAYGAFWLLSFGGDALSLYGAQADIANKTSVEWFFSSPLMALAGIFFAYKLAWLVAVAVSIGLWRIGERRLTLAMLLLIASAIPLLMLGLDTSRLMGFGFMGFLIAVALWFREPALTPRRDLLNLLLLGNVLIPSYFVDLNQISFGITRAYGLYPAIDSFLRQLSMGALR
jgi:hypothetical protein